MKERLNDHAGALALAALIVAVLGATMAGAGAAGILVGSKQIRNGSILTQDIHQGGVQSSDVKNGTVSSADIGNGEVEPQDVTMPAPDQIQEVPGDVASANVGPAFAPVDTVGTYPKEDPSSLLEVTWTGSASSAFGSCVFQLRVDGAPAGESAGEVLATNAESVTATALFSGLAAGPHTVEVWARHAGADPGTYACIVGPASAGIGQTFVVAEQVV